MWHDYLIEGDEGIREILHKVKRIAVVGMQDESHDKEASHTVPKYLSEQGYDVIPVNPKYSNILGKNCYKSLAELEEEVDAVLVFRTPGKVPPHAKETLELQNKPKVFWMQKGVRNMDAAHRLAVSGIKVVQDHCMYAEHLRLIHH